MKLTRIYKRRAQSAKRKTAGQGRAGAVVLRFTLKRFLLALLRRFRKDDSLPTLHPLVDLCNAVSLAFALPVAVIDLDQVEGFIQVRHADGDETYHAFSGEVEHPEP